MAAKYRPCLVICTAPTREEAEKIGGVLLAQQLAACIQYEPIKSQYIWQGGLCSDEEVRLTIKTSRHLYRKTEQTIRAHHSYECPQIIMQAIDGGAKAYLRWAKTVLGL